MAETLTLKTNVEPTIWNKDLLLGAFIGGIGGFIVPGFGLITAAAGGVIGAALGKNRMEKEANEGKKVGEPSFWNKDTLLGGLIGFYGVGLVGLAMAALTLGGVAVTAGAPAIAAGVGVTGVVLMALSMITAPFIGAYIGGKHGKAMQEKELEQAKNQQLVQNISQNISPEIGQAVEYTLQHKKDWGKGILDEKLQAMAQPPHVG